jgi:hypothetical protein
LYITGLKGTTFIIHLIGRKICNLKIIERNFFWEGPINRVHCKKNLIFEMHSQLINMDYK